MPLINAQAILGLELRYYCGNIAEIKRNILFTPNISYRSKYSLQDQLSQIKYIAGQDEWKSIKKIAKKSKEDAIEYFWESHNSSPGSLTNEIRELFYERVQKADELFTIHKKIPGWSSDRGRIFIQKGAPDDISEEIFPLGRYPYIIWQYFYDNTTYRFYDKTGFGNYELEDEYREN